MSKILFNLLLLFSIFALSTNSYAAASENVDATRNASPPAHLISASSLGGPPYSSITTPSDPQGRIAIRGEPNEAPLASKVVDYLSTSQANAHAEREMVHAERSKLQAEIARLNTCLQQSHESEIAQFQDIITQKETQIKEQQKQIEIMMGATFRLPVGTVSPFAGSKEPQGWLFCLGQPVSREIYTELYENIGITYGAGDGSTTFNLPDLRGRSVFGNDSIGGIAAGRLTVFSVSTGIQLGTVGGSESHTLTVDEIPPHRHQYQTGHGERSGAPSGAPANAGGQGGGQNLATGFIGGGQAHSVMNPFIVLNYIIKY